MNLKYDLFLFIDDLENLKHLKIRFILNYFIDALNNLFLKSKHPTNQDSTFTLPKLSLYPGFEDLILVNLPLTCN